jgi:hypothetical protein
MPDSTDDPNRDPPPIDGDDGQPVTKPPNGAAIFLAGFGLGLATGLLIGAVVFGGKGGGTDTTDAGSATPISADAGTTAPPPPPPAPNPPR